MKKHIVALVLAGVILAILLCLACVASVLLWRRYGEDDQTPYELGRGMYTYDPRTILAEIDRNDGLEEVPMLPTPNPLAEPIIWEQSDFLQLALVLVDLNGSEGWYLVDLGFRVSCDEVANGPQSMYFNFRKKFVQTEDGKGLGVLGVYIDARNGRADWIAEAVVPPFGEYYSDQPELDIGELVSAQAALHIAEEEGGSSFRENLPDDASSQCEVSGLLIRKKAWLGWQHPTWRIWYEYGEEHKQLPEWEICVDAESGGVTSCDN